MKRFEFSWTPESGWRGLDNAAVDPSLILFFGARMAMAEHSVFGDLRAKFPGAIIVGCSGGGQIHSDGVLDTGITGVAMSFASTKIRVESAPAHDSFDSFTTGRSLGANLAGEKLAGVLLFTDGIEVNGDELLAGLASSLPPNVVIGGGMAADDDRFEKTLIAANAPPSANMIAAIGFYGDDIRLTSACGDGWKEAGVEFKITASRMNKLYDLDGVPALELYEVNLGEQAQQLPMSGLSFPLRVCDPNNQNVSLVRTLLGIDRDVGMLTFAGNVPEGWMAQLMHAEPLDLISAAAEAAEGRNMDALADAQVAILVSCIGRRLILGTQSGGEVMSLKNALGGSPAISGFYSYGEFATPTKHQKPRLFNQSITVFGISEEEIEAA